MLFPALSITLLCLSPAGSQMLSVCTVVGALVVLNLLSFSKLLLLSVLLSNSSQSTSQAVRSAPKRRRYAPQEVIPTGCRSLLSLLRGFARRNFSISVLNGVFLYSSCLTPWWVSPRVDGTAMTLRNGFYIVGIGILEYNSI